MRAWRDKIVHFLPFWLFGLALFMKIMFLLTEFSLTCYVSVCYTLGVKIDI